MPTEHRASAREKPWVPDPRRLEAWLDHPDARACEPAHVALLRRDLAEAVLVSAPDGPCLMRRDQILGVVRPYGSVVLYLPTDLPAPRHRLLELDRHGHVTLAIRRGPNGELREAWLRNVDDTLLAVHPGDAAHPLWGASDRIVKLPEGSGAPVPLTVCAAIDWLHIAAIPALADPSRLPPGAGTTILNLVAALATDQGVGSLRYRGPYPTEQLFWALLECFRFTPAGPDPVGAFTRDAEAVFAAGESRVAPLDWTPAPHERLFLDGGVYVQLRDGVEKVAWEGRSYYRPEWQGLLRREHRVIRAATEPGGRFTFTAGLEALGHPLEDHLVFDADGHVRDRPAPEVDAAGPDRDVALAPVWQSALAALLPLEATPLLAVALDAMWPTLEVVWGVVPRDLVETRGRHIRLARVLARAYQAEQASLPAVARRTLAQRLVRDVLGLVGSPARAAAAAWLAGEPPARQETLLRAESQADRPALAARAALRLTPLLEALEAGEALPD